LIVLDASAVNVFLLRANEVVPLTDAIANCEHIACPLILDFEVLNTLRKQVYERVVTVGRAEEALDLYGQLPFVRYPTSILADKIWAMRNNFTAYDAAYIALAEFLEVPIYTKDRKWMNKPGHTAVIHYI
jgi:predicted nucleic acid-binding protein